MLLKFGVITMDRENETELNATEVLRMSFELKKALEMIANDLNIDVLIKISSDLNKSNIIVSNEIRSLEEYLKGLDHD